MSVSTQLGEQRQVTLPQGTIHYRERGEGPAIVFIHGLLVNGDLWRKVVPPLSTHFRCIAPDLPLGSHSPPMRDGTELSVRAVAEIVADLLEALDLEDVTLVGSDTGGAICQTLITTRPERIGRLVLTPCDAFEVFPPALFSYLLLVPRIPGATFLLTQSMRIPLSRKLPIAYGALSNTMPERAVMDAYVRPLYSNAANRRDLNSFIRNSSKQDTIESGRKLGGFDKPVLLAWDDEDRFFKRSLAERLRSAFPNARLEIVPNSRTFVSEDQPQALAQLIEQFARERQPA